MLSTYISLAHEYLLRGCCIYRSLIIHNLLSYSAAVGKRTGRRLENEYRKGLRGINEPKFLIGFIIFQLTDDNRQTTILGFWKFFTLIILHNHKQQTDL